jgi:AcrR family transcriptional regulator
LLAGAEEATDRLLLERTVRRLFVTPGFEVIVAEIAGAADVSEATVFNYFPTNEDLAFGRMQSFEEEMLDAIRGRPVGEPVLTGFSRFISSHAASSPPPTPAPPRNWRACHG